MGWRGGSVDARGSATRGQPARSAVGEAPLWGARGGTRQNDRGRRRGTSRRAVKRRRSFGSEMNAPDVQRPGRGGFELLALAKLKDCAASHVNGVVPERSRLRLPPADLPVDCPTRCYVSFSPPLCLRTGTVRVRRSGKIGHNIRWAGRTAGPAGQGAVAGGVA